MSDRLDPTPLTYPKTEHQLCMFLDAKVRLLDRVSSWRIVRFQNLEQIDLGVRQKKIDYLSAILSKTVIIYLSIDQ